MEELKKGLKRKIRRKLIVSKKSLTTVMEWFERSIKVDKCKRQVLVKESCMDGLESKDQSKRRYNR